MFELFNFFNKKKKDEDLIQQPTARMEQPKMSIAPSRQQGRLKIRQPQQRQDLFSNFLQNTPYTEQKTPQRSTAFATAKIPVRKPPVQEANLMDTFDKYVSTKPSGVQKTYNLAKDIFYDDYGYNQKDLDKIRRDRIANSGFKMDDSGKLYQEMYQPQDPYLQTRSAAKVAGRLGLGMGELVQGAYKYNPANPFFYSNVYQRARGKTPYDPISDLGQKIIQRARPYTEPKNAREAELMQGYDVASNFIPGGIVSKDAKGLTFAEKLAEVALNKRKAAMRLVKSSHPNNVPLDEFAEKFWATRNVSPAVRNGFLRNVSPNFKDAQRRSILERLKFLRENDPTNMQIAELEEEFANSFKPDGDLIKAPPKFSSPNKGFNLLDATSRRKEAENAIVESKDLDLKRAAFDYLNRFKNKIQSKPKSYGERSENYFYDVMDVPSAFDTLSGRTKPRSKMEGYTEYLGDMGDNLNFGATEDEMRELYQGAYANEIGESTADLDRLGYSIDDVASENMDDFENIDNVFEGQPTDLVNAYKASNTGKRIDNIDNIFYKKDAEGGPSFFGKVKPASAEEVSKIRFGKGDKGFYGAGSAPYTNNFVEGGVGEAPVYTDPVFNAPVIKKNKLDKDGNVIESKEVMLGPDGRETTESELKRFFDMSIGKKAATYAMDYIDNLTKKIGFEPKDAGEVVNATVMDVFEAAKDKADVEEEIIAELNESLMRQSISESKKNIDYLNRKLKGADAEEAKKLVYAYGLSEKLRNLDRPVTSKEIVNWFKPLFDDSVSRGLPNSIQGNLGDTKAYLLDMLNRIKPPKISKFESTRGGNRAPMPNSINRGLYFTDPTGVRDVQALDSQIDTFSKPLGLPIGNGTYRLPPGRYPRFSYGDNISQVRSTPFGLRSTPPVGENTTALLKTPEGFRAKQTLALPSGPEPVQPNIKLKLDSSEPVKGKNLNMFQKQYISGEDELTRLGKYGDNLNILLAKKLGLEEKLTDKLNTLFEPVKNKLSTLGADSVKNVILATGGRKSMSELSSEESKIVGELRDLLDTIYVQSKEMGVEGGYKGNYFPFKYDKSYLSGGKNESATLEYLVNNGFAEDYAEASAKLAKKTEEKALGEQYAGRKSGRLEGERTLEFPEEAIIPDINSIRAYIDEASRRIAESSILGPKDENIVKNLDALEKLGLDRDRAANIVNRNLNRIPYNKADKIGDFISRGANILFMPWAGINNISQLSNPIAFGGLKNTLKSTGKALNPFDKSIYRQAEDVGAFQPEYIIQGATDKTPNKAERISGITMTGTEKGLRAISADVGKKIGEEIANTLEKKGVSGLSKKQHEQLNKMGIGVDHFETLSDGTVRLKPEMVDKTMKSFSDETQFIVNNLTVPHNWRNPKLRPIYQYMAFQYLQYQKALKPAVKLAVGGNVVPLLSLLGGYAAISYGTTKAVNYVTGAGDKEVVNKDGDFRAFLDNASTFTGGAIGMPMKGVDYATHAYDTLTNEYQTPLQKGIKLTGETLGPAASKVAEGLNAGIDLAGGDSLPAKRFGASLIPGASKPLNNTVFSWDSNDYNSESNQASSAEIAATNKMLNSPLAPKVARVIDGDTFVLDNGQRVRLIGVDAPEMSTPQGVQAKNRLANLLMNENVDIKFQVDRYDRSDDSDTKRLLATVFVDGKPAGKVLIDEGYARPRNIGPNNERTQEYWDAYETAKAGGKGFWGDPNVQVPLEAGYGKDANWFINWIKPDLGKDVPNFDPSHLKEWKGKSADEATTLAKENKYSLSDEQLLYLRSTADKYSDYFLGGDKNPSERFRNTEFTSLQDKLTNAVNKEGGKSMKSTVADLYASTNYTPEEKSKLYAMMGIDDDEAERLTLGHIKDDRSTLLPEDASIIYDYLSEKSFDPQVVQNLFDDKTLTISNIKEMDRQGLLTPEQAALLAGGYSHNTGKNLRYSGVNKGVGGSSKGSSKTKAKKLKFTAAPKIKITFPESDLTKLSGISDVKKGENATPALPKLDKIDSSFKLRDSLANEPKYSKIKIKFDTGLNK